VKSILSGPPASPESSFRLLLQSELARRCAAHAQYSLRAFAMQLEVDHSTLSQWIRGRRPITARAIETIGEKLGLAKDAIARYVENAGRDGEGESEEARGQLSSETAALIADWHHFAILELTRLRQFRPDSRWIARVLGIGVDDVNVALQRLIRLGLLEMADKARWVDLAGDAAVSVDGVDSPTRVALLGAPAASPAAAGAHERSAITLTVAAARVPQAIARITRLRQQLIDELQAEPADDVYRLEIALYPLTTLAQAKETTT
jgi:uncharacterized protein (TIGR02147 family)